MMNHPRPRIAGIAALAVITGAAGVFEAAGARYACRSTDGVTRTEPQRLPAPTVGFEITQVELPVIEASGQTMMPLP